MDDSDFTFAEDLPPSCPSGAASREPRNGFWRFVMVKYPETPLRIDDRAFTSQHGRAMPCPPHKDPCDWASCSMFEEERARTMALIPPFKNKPAVCLNLTADAGPSRLDDDGHLHLWRFAGYDISKDVTKYVSKL